MRILGYEYSLDASKTIEELGGNMGFCNFSLQQISVARDIKMDGKLSTLVHEVIEALNYHLELNLKHKQISALEVGLNQVLSENGIDLSVLLDGKK